MLLFKGWIDCGIVESFPSLCCFKCGLTAVFWILHSPCCCFKPGLQYCGVCSLSVLLFQAWIAVLWSLFTLCVVVSSVDCSIVESVHSLCCRFRRGLTAVFWSLFTTLSMGCVTHWSPTVSSGANTSRYKVLEQLSFFFLQTLGGGWGGGILFLCILLLHF